MYSKILALQSFWISLGMGGVLMSYFTGEKDSSISISPSEVLVQYFNSGASVQWCPSLTSTILSILVRTCKVQFPYFTFFYILIRLWCLQSFYWMFWNLHFHVSYKYCLGATGEGLLILLISDEFKHQKPYKVLGDLFYWKQGILNIQEGWSIERDIHPRVECLLVSEDLPQENTVHVPKFSMWMPA